MTDLPTCAHDVTLPPPGDPGFCPLCLRAKLAAVTAERDRYRLVANARTAASAGGLANVIGKWPSDETDEQINEALEKLS